ncbi:MAG: dihydrolipoyl dehydrogenase, partial [Anaerolineales bacterium]|nr:dihydrolipoyl dehydrogenase [Anaerolineales bacterium]
MSTEKTKVTVIGAGPGGYTAAFHAAQLGMDVTMIDTRDNPGGVCLNVGCIPSKALLHAAGVVAEARHSAEIGLKFGDPELDLAKLRSWKDKIVSQLTGGLGQLAKKHKVRFINGFASFKDAGSLVVKTGSGIEEVDFDYAIVATGSIPSTIPGIELESDRVMDSTGALALPDIPKSLLVVGGGYIGLELGSVYSALGSSVSVVEFMGSLLPGADQDLVRPLERKIKKSFNKIYLKTKVTGMAETKSGVAVTFEGKINEKIEYDRVLVAIGRRPYCEGMGIENTKIEVDKIGFIKIDNQMRTSEPNIFAIGDIAGQPMLAHKGMREAKVAVEVIAGQDSVFNSRVIPAVVFTDPEIAWAGLTEPEAKEQWLDVKVTRFPWAASGRALTMGRNEGLTKMVFDPATGSILGVGIVGAHAGELIAEGAL